MSFLFFLRFLYRKKYSKVDLIKNAKSLRNVYGVPSCGIVFKRESIVKFGLFKDINGAAWDYRNFRLFNNVFTVGILHKYLAVRRIYTGMSNTEMVQKEFYKEKCEMIKENQNIKVVRKYGKAVIDKKPFITYFFGVFLSNMFFFLHNLDSTKAISSVGFKKIIKRGYHL